MKKLLALLALLFIVGCTGPVLLPTPTPTVIVPTMTPIPTLTPTPSPTPEPTATVMSETVLSSSLTLEEWADQIGLQAGITADALERMADLHAVALPDEPIWIDLYTTEVVKIQDAERVLRAIVPPEEAREAHEMLLAAYSDYVLFTEYCLQGILQRDSAPIRKAQEYLESGGMKLKLSKMLAEDIGAIKDR